MAFFSCLAWLVGFLGVQCIFKIQLRPLQQLGSFLGQYKEPQICA
ncbi:hypothetical protein ACN4EE_07935 [Geminocystis sp. CENA526]